MTLFRMTGVVRKPPGYWAPTRHHDHLIGTTPKMTGGPDDWTSKVASSAIVGVAVSDDGADLFLTFEVERANAAAIRDEFRAVDPFTIAAPGPPLGAVGWLEATGPKEIGVSGVEGTYATGLHGAILNARMGLLTSWWAALTPAAPPPRMTWALLNAFSAWLDATYPDMPVELRLRRRVDKIAEEFGEVMEAVGGLYSENPRKGHTHDLADIRYELLDVATTALGAVAHTYENDARVDVLDLLDEHIREVAGRADIR